MAQGDIGFAQDRGTTAKAKGRSAIEKLFSPEFRNRLDAVVTFKPLSPEVMETIVEKFIFQLEAQLRERRVEIKLLPEARSYLGKKGYDPAYGARPLGRLIQTEVRDPLTEQLLFGPLEHGGTVTIGLESGALKFSFDPSPAPAPPEPAPSA
jgi:ATP-dependent Clp protease ATP-binding subunit ClpA